MGVLKDISEQRRTHAGVLLLYKVAAWKSFSEKKKTAKVKVTRSSLSKKKRLHGDFYTSTFLLILKNDEHDIKYLCESASEIMSKKEFVILNLFSS